MNVLKFKYEEISVFPCYLSSLLNRNIISWSLWSICQPTNYMMRTATHKWKIHVSMKRKNCGRRIFSVLKDPVPWRCYVTWWKWGLRWMRMTLHVYKVAEGNILWIYFNVIKTNPACWLFKNFFFLDKSEKMKWNLKSSSKT